MRPVRNLRPPHPVRILTPALCECPLAYFFSGSPIRAMGDSGHAENSPCQQSRTRHPRVVAKSGRKRLNEPLHWARLLEYPAMKK